MDEDRGFDKARMKTERLALLESMKKRLEACLRMEAITGVPSPETSRTAKIIMELIEE